MQIRQRMSPRPYGLLFCSDGTRPMLLISPSPLSQKRRLQPPSREVELRRRPPPIWCPSTPARRAPQPARQQCRAGAARRAYSAHGAISERARQRPGGPSGAGRRFVTPAAPVARETAVFQPAPGGPHAVGCWICAPACPSASGMSLLPEEFEMCIFCARQSLPYGSGRHRMTGLPNGLPPQPSSPQ